MLRSFRALICESSPPGFRRKKRVSAWARLRLQAFSLLGQQPLYKKINAIILFISIPLVTLAADRIVYVTNPDLTKYEMSWIGRSPQCHETNVYGDTYGWIYHAVEATPITIMIKSKLFNNVICTILISDYVKDNDFPSVTGSGCYFVKSNGSEKMNYGSTYVTWVTTNDAAPYQSHACGN